MGSQANLSPCTQTLKIKKNVRQKQKENLELEWNNSRGNTTSQTGIFSTMCPKAAFLLLDHAINNLEIRRFRIILNQSVNSRYLVS